MAYHPQANGMLERVHRRLKDALRARAVGDKWVDELPWILLYLRATPREDTGLSPAEATYGSPLVLPGQFLEGKEAPTPAFFNQLREAMSNFLPTPACHNIPADDLPPEELPQDLLQAEHVLVWRDGFTRSPLAPRYDGPYRVKKRALHYFTLQMGDKEEKVSVHRLKAAYLPVGAEAAVLPRRGRPPGQRLHVTFLEKATDASTSTDLSK